MRFFTKLWAYTKLGKFFDRVNGGVVVGDVTLQTPTTGYTTADLTPDFNWTDATNATSYRIQIATDVAFTAIVETGTPAVSNYTSTGLTAGQTYYWRARGENGATYGNWAAAFTLKTLGTVTLDTPADASFTSDTTPTFTWNAATNATGYVMELATSNSFGGTIIQTYTGANTTYTATEIATDGWLYWRVRPTAESGAEVGSNTVTRSLELFNSRYCLDLDGTNDLWTIPDASIFRLNEGAGGKPMSWSIWVNADALGAVHKGIISKSPGGAGREYMMWWDSSQALYFYVFGNSAGTISIGRGTNATPFSTGNPVHLVFTYNGSSTLTIWVNAVQKDTLDSNAGVWGAPYSTTNPINVGASYTNLAWRYFNGKQDELAVYSKALSSTEISNLYNSGNKRDARLVATANLIGYWKNNENTGTNINDEISTNDGTLPASPQTPSWTTW